MSLLQMIWIFQFIERLSIRTHVETRVGLWVKLLIKVSKHVFGNFFSKLFSVSDPGPVSWRCRKALAHPESHSKISNLMITELFYSGILNMNRCSLHTRSFMHIMHFSVFRYRLNKNGFPILKATFVCFNQLGQLHLKKHIPNSRLEYKNLIWDQNGRNQYRYPHFNQNG